MHAIRAESRQERRNDDESHPDEPLDDQSVGDDDGGVGDDDDIEPNDDDETGFQTDDDDGGEDDGWIRDAHEAAIREDGERFPDVRNWHNYRITPNGDARCNFCDGPMPCFCEPPPGYVPDYMRPDYEGGPICGDREGW